VDLFFLFFAAYDSDEQNVKKPKPDQEFGPDFNPIQFGDRLNDDIKKASQRKCRKISGNDETYAKVKTAVKELGSCLKNFTTEEEIQTASSKLETKDDLKALIKTVCRKRDVPIKCIDDYTTLSAQCSYPSEIAIENSIRRIITSMSEVICTNDGNDLFSLTSGQGRECVLENLTELKTCSIKALYAIVKGIVVKFVENETFELKMDAEDCKAYDETESCYLSSVKDCDDTTANTYFSSLFRIVRNETECSNIESVQNNLLT